MPRDGALDACALEPIRRHRADNIGFPVDRSIEWSPGASRYSGYAEGSLSVALVISLGHRTIGAGRNSRFDKKFLFRAPARQVGLRNTDKSERRPHDPAAGMMLKAKRGKDISSIGLQ